MSYDAKEISTREGNPIELYKFESAAPATLLTITSGDATITYGGEDYAPAMISRSELKLTTELNSDNLKVSVPRDYAIAAMWIEFSPQDTIWLTIYRQHRDDALLETKTIWKGRVRGAAWAGSEAVLECEPLVGILKRPCLRAQYQALCNHMLGDARCTIDLETDTDINGVERSFTAAKFNQATITNISGKKYYADTFLAADLCPGDPDPYNDYFQGGYVIDLVTGERRLIVKHDGSAGQGYVELWQGFSGVAISDDINAYAGCARTALVCDSKFGNIESFGGFPAMPTFNPFTYMQRRVKNVRGR